MKKGLDYYMSLQYGVNLRPLAEEDGGGWLAEIAELPGCVSDGETKVEALENVEKAKAAWFAVSLKKGFKIPEPAVEAEPEYNGRVTLRLPKSLHRKTSEEAKEEGVSLNSYLQCLIAENHSAAMANKVLAVCQKLIDKQDERYYDAQHRLMGSIGSYDILEEGGIKVVAKRH